MTATRFMHARSWRALAGPGDLAKALALSLALGLAACGGGGDEATPAGPTAQARSAVVDASALALLAAAPVEAPIAVFPGRGELLGALPLGSFTREAIQQAADIPGARAGGVSARYAVDTWRLLYRTLDGQGHLVTASALVAAPHKLTPSVSVTSPVIAYQHGTIFHDAEAPSNALAPGEASIVMASLGYLVVAADYVGYGASKGIQHPYLLSAPTAAAVVDGLTAARLWRQQPAQARQRGNGQLFLLGYSEGGYATAAAQREIEKRLGVHHETLVASVAGGGPQDVGVTLDQLLVRVREKNFLLGALINPGFLSHLGSTLRDEVRRAMLREIIPGDADVGFQSTFLDHFLADDVNAIDRDCNVLNWKASVPTRLFHGLGDQTVTYFSSRNALQYLLAAGTPSQLVSLTDCSAVPSDHLPCAGEFFRRAAPYLEALARDL